MVDWLQRQVYSLGEHLIIEGFMKDCPECNLRLRREEEKRARWHLLLGTEITFSLPRQIVTCPHCGGKCFAGTEDDCLYLKQLEENDDAHD